MVYLKKESFPIGTYNKLKMRKLRPCKILQKFDSGNSYEVELPEALGISPIFNVVYIYEYHEGKSSGSNNEVDLKDQLPHQTSEQIEQILDTKIGRDTRNKQYKEDLVKWKGGLVEDSSWIYQAEVDHFGFPLAPKK